MQDTSINSQQELINKISRFWNDERDRILITKTIQALIARNNLSPKMTAEPEVEGIIEQMASRLENSYPKLTELQGKRVLDIACGSNSSKLPASFFLNTLFNGRLLRANRGYTALFEP